MAIQKSDYQTVRDLPLNGAVHCKGKIISLYPKQARHLRIAGFIKPATAMATNKKTKK